MVGATDLYMIVKCDDVFTTSITVYVLTVSLA